MKRISAMTDDELSALQEHCWQDLDRTLARRSRRRARANGPWLNVAFSLTILLIGVMMALAAPYPRVTYSPLSTEFRGIPY